MKNHPADDIQSSGNGRTDVNVPKGSPSDRRYIHSQGGLSGEKGIDPDPYGSECDRRSRTPPKLTSLMSDTFMCLGGVKYKIKKKIILYKNAKTLKNHQR